MSEAWKRLSSGKYIDLNNFSEDDVDIKDMSVSVKKNFFNLSSKKDFVDMEEMYNVLCQKLRS